MTRLHPKLNLSRRVGASAACSGGSDFQQRRHVARAVALSGNLMVRVAIDTNDAAKSGTRCADLGADWASCARGRLILENAGNTRLASGSWTVYVHSIRRILMVDQPDFAWRHVTGDFYALTPRAGAFTLGAGERVEVPFVGEYWYQHSDLLPRAYVVADGAQPAIFKHNDTDDETRCVEAIPPISDDAVALAATSAQIMRARAEAALPSAQQSAARALPAVLRTAQGEGAVQISGIDLSLSGLTPSQTFALISRAAALDLNGTALPVSGARRRGSIACGHCDFRRLPADARTAGANIDAFH